jgi:16S rRNA (guanine527-N7)-methyltransferase
MYGNIAAGLRTNSGVGMIQSSAIMAEWMARQGHEPLTDEQTALLARYRERLLEVNQYMNLTAITSEKEIAVKHFIDSLTLLPWLTPGAKVLDIGSGAGFPGMVLKIARMDLHMTLMDSLRKRVFFLSETAEMLGLDGIRCVHARAEEVSRRPEYKAQYDVVTARAVAKLDALAGYALPFLREGGLFLAMKGPHVRDEVNGAKAAVKKHGGVINEVRETEISEEIKHTVVVIKKGSKK